MSTKINTKLDWKSAIILTVVTAVAAISTTDVARSFVAKSPPAAIATNTQSTYLTPDAVTPNRQQQRIIGIYQGRFELTANVSEQEIRNRVRHFRARGFNTLVQGVWGNGCGMYASAVNKQLVGTARCPNHFNDRAVEWTIDEAHKQGIQFHAYFEKGIKIDKNSPIFSLAVGRKWLLSGMDRADSQHPYYLLDVANPEVAEFYRSTVTEFVRKYPQVDAVQFDDYLSYAPELLEHQSPADRQQLVTNLTTFVNNLVTATKQANPQVSFDICDFNDYWAGKMYGADLANWHVDRRFIEAYRDSDFEQELSNARGVSGIAIGQNQLHRLPAILENSQMNLFLFPLDV